MATTKLILFKDREGNPTSTFEVPMGTEGFFKALIREPGLIRLSDLETIGRVLDKFLADKDFGQDLEDGVGGQGGPKQLPATARTVTEDKCFFIPTVNNGPEDMDTTFFSGEEVVNLPMGSDIFDVLVASGLFPSKGQARKNWKLGQLEPGLNEFREIGKKKVNVFVHVEIPETLS